MKGVEDRKNTQKNALIDWRTGGQNQRTEGHNKREIKIKKKHPPSQDS